MPQGFVIGPTNDKLLGHPSAITSIIQTRKPFIIVNHFDELNTIAQRLIQFNYYFQAKPLPVYRKMVVLCALTAYEIGSYSAPGIPMNMKKR